MNRLNTFGSSCFVTLFVLFAYLHVLAASPGPCDTVSFNFPEVEVTLCSDSECALIEDFIGYDLYSWSNGETGSSIVICEQGSYSVTVTDANGCTAVGYVEVGKYSNDPGVISADICPGEYIVIHGVIYDLTGTYTDTLISVGGCDSILIITIVEVPLEITTIEVSFCSGDTVFIGDDCYFTPGIYTKLLESVGSGCDTIVTISITEKALEDRAINDGICLGDSIFFNDKWISEIGIYIDTIPSQTDGCDTVVTLNLIIDIEQTPYSTITPDSGTGTGRIELYDNACFAYQWSNGRTGPIIKNLSKGDYTVTITSDIGYEEIITYSVPGPFDILDYARDDELEAYPNPFLNGFNLTIPDISTGHRAELIVTDCIGRLVHSSQVDRNHVVHIGSTLQPGLYFVFLISHEEVLASTRVLKTD